MLLVVVKEWNPATNHVCLYAVPVNDKVIDQNGFVITTDGEIRKSNSRNDPGFILDYAREFRGRTINFSRYNADDIVILKTDKDLVELRKWLERSDYRNRLKYSPISKNCAHAVADALEQSDIDLTVYHSNKNKFKFKRLMLFFHCWSDILTPNDIFTYAKKSQNALPVHEVNLILTLAKLAKHVSSTSSEKCKELKKIIRSLNKIKCLDEKCAFLTYHINNNTLLKRHRFLSGLTFFDTRGDTEGIALLKSLRSAFLQKKYGHLADEREKVPTVQISTQENFVPLFPFRV